MEEKLKTAESKRRKQYTSVEICAGGGGQALGLESAGFRHAALIEMDRTSCETLRFNRPRWNVIEDDVRKIDGQQWIGVDLLSGGVPCPPFSIAGKQRGGDDDRDLFPEILRLTRESRPRAVMVENVRGLLGKRFEGYRQKIIKELGCLGYVAEWNLLNACDFGVPQLRPRSVLVALHPDDFQFWKWPVGSRSRTPTVGETLFSTMSANGWNGADEWASGASSIAPTLVGGSHKHGGADLGPTRSKAAWAAIGVNGHGLADELPARDHIGPPKLTVEQAALIQGFPSDWEFQGRKTASYRQVGNAFPPPVAKAVGAQIKKAWIKSDRVAANQPVTSDRREKTGALESV